MMVGEGKAHGFKTPTDQGPTTRGTQEVAQAEPPKPIGVGAAGASLQIQDRLRLEGSSIRGCAEFPAEGMGGLQIAANAGSPLPGGTAGRKQASLSAEARSGRLLDAAALRRLQ